MKNSLHMQSSNAEVLGSWYITLVNINYYINLLRSYNISKEPAYKEGQQNHTTVKAFETNSYRYRCLGPTIGPKRPLYYLKAKVYWIGANSKRAIPQELVNNAIRNSFQEAWWAIVAHKLLHFSTTFYFADYQNRQLGSSCLAKALKP